MRKGKAHLFYHGRSKQIAQRRAKEVRGQGLYGKFKRVRLVACSGGIFEVRAYK